MARAHWSDDVYVVCWRDARSNGRMRMSWHADLSILIRDVLMLASCTDAVVYRGCGERVSWSMRQAAPPPGTPKKKVAGAESAPAKKKRKPRATAVAA